MNSRQHYAIAVEAARQRRLLVLKRCASSHRQNSNCPNNLVRQGDSGSDVQDRARQNGYENISANNVSETRREQPPSTSPETLSKRLLNVTASDSSGLHCVWSIAEKRRQRPASRDRLPSATCAGAVDRHRAVERTTSTRNACVLEFESLITRQGSVENSRSSVTSRPVTSHSVASTMGRPGRHFRKTVAKPVAKLVAEERDSDSLVDLLLSLLQPIARQLTEKSHET